MTQDNQNQQQGRITPKELNKGPLSERKCTDIFCLLIFTVFWAGMVFVAFKASKDGDPWKLTHPYNQFDHQCGLGTYKDFKYIYFVPGTPPANDKDANPLSSRRNTCVKTCPAEDTSTLECADDYVTAVGACSTIKVYATHPVLNRVCVPKDNKMIKYFSKVGAFNGDTVMQAISDIKNVWWMILVVALITLVVGFIYLFLIKYCAGVLVWGALAILIILLAVVGVLCLKPVNSVDLSDYSPSFFDNLDPTLRKAIGFCSFFFGFLVLLFVCCCRSRISLSIAVLKCAAEFIQDEMSILFIPPLFFVLTVVFYCAWAVAVVYIMGTNEIRPRKSKRPIPKILWTKEATYFLIYYVFALLWNNAFLIALCQFFIASATCLWYFDQGKVHSGRSSVWASIKRSFYHLGSIAFGSFLIGLLNAVRIILHYVSVQLNKVQSEQGCLAFCVKCCSCCMKCFENFLKFLNTHAYIQIAMTGANFCTATKDAFGLTTRNGVRFTLVHGLAWVFLLIGKLFIAAASTVAGYFIITKTSLKDDITTPIPLTIIFGVVAYLIASVFMQIYGISSDSIIHCFAMDEEMHDGNARFAPEQLKEFMDNSVPSNQKKLLYN